MKYFIGQDCTNPGSLSLMQINFFMVAPHINGPLVWNWFQVALMAPRIVSVLDFLNLVDS